MPWIRFNLYDWISGTDGMTLEQRGVYITLLVRMYDKKAPIKTDFETLARACNCSQKKFATIVEYLISDDKLIETDDGLWNRRVEEELKDFADKKDYISRVRSEAGKKGAQAKSNIKQHVDNFAEANVKQNNDFAEAKIKQNVFFAEANDKQNQAIKNKNNIYKKNKTIVLSKKETEFEDLETIDLVDEPIECDDVDSQSELIETSSENQSPIHEQESVPKKAKRAKTNRECRLPADFEPNLQYAIDKGLTHDEALLEFERFTNYWEANPYSKAKKRDWQMTWYNWITSPIGALAKKKEKLEREKQYGNFSKDQKTCGGTGEAIRNLIREAGFSESTSKHCRSDGEVRHNGISMDLDQWRAIDTSTRGTSFYNLSDNPKLTYLESVC